MTTTWGNLQVACALSIKSEPVNCVGEGILCMYFWIRTDLSNIVTKQRVSTHFTPVSGTRGTEGGCKPVWE